MLVLTTTYAVVSSESEVDNVCVSITSVMWKVTIPGRQLLEPNKSASCCRQDPYMTVARKSPLSTRYVVHIMWYIKISSQLVEYRIWYLVGIKYKKTHALHDWSTRLNSSHLKSDRKISSTFPSVFGWKGRRDPWSLGFLVEFPRGFLITAWRNSRDPPSGKSLQCC